MRFSKYSIINIVKRSIIDGNVLYTHIVFNACNMIKESAEFFGAFAMLILYQTKSLILISFVMITICPYDKVFVSIIQN